MVGIFKRKPWIDDKSVDYLMGISPLFTIKYCTLVNGTRIKNNFRNERGELVADLFTENVVEISIHYQESGMLEVFPVGKEGITESRNLGALKVIFDKFIDQYPKTKSNFSVEELHKMQKELQDQIERIVNVYGWDKPKESKSNNINIYLNSIKPEYRERLMDFLVRLDKCSIPVTITLGIDGTTDEMIGSTLNELALYEMEDGEKNADPENSVD